MTEEKFRDHEKRIRSVEFTQIEMHGDIKHIKDRIDNGMSGTLRRILDVVTDMKPKVNFHNRFIWTFLSILLVGVIGGGIKILVAALGG